MQIHVVPEEETHEGTLACACHPSLELHENRAVIIHNRGAGRPRHLIDFAEIITDDDEEPD